MMIELRETPSYVAQCLQKTTLPSGPLIVAKSMRKMYDHRPSFVVLSHLNESLCTSSCFVVVVGEEVGGVPWYSVG